LCKLYFTFCKTEEVDDFPVETTDSDFPVETVGVDPRRGSIDASMDDL
jgi:hypothetical protein